MRTGLCVWRMTTYLRLEADLGNTRGMLKDSTDIVVGLVDKAAGNAKVVGDEVGDLVTHVRSLEGLLPDNDFAGLEVSMAIIRKN